VVAATIAAAARGGKSSLDLDNPEGSPTARPRVHLKAKRTLFE
jgi:hypothetical protein